MKRFLFPLIVMVFLSCNSDTVEKDISKTINGLISYRRNLIAGEKIVIGVNSKRGIRDVKGKYSIKIDGKEYHPDERGTIYLHLDKNEVYKDVILRKRENLKIMFAVNFAISQDYNKKRKLFKEDDYEFVELLNDKLIKINAEKNYYSGYKEDIEGFTEKIKETIETLFQYFPRTFVKKEIFLLKEGNYHYPESNRYVLVVNDYSDLYGVLYQFIHELVEISTVKKFNLYTNNSAEDQRWIGDGIANYLTFQLTERFFGLTAKANTTFAMHKFIEENVAYDLLLWETVGLDDKTDVGNLSVAGYYIAPVAWADIFYHLGNSAAEKILLKYSRNNYTGINEILSSKGIFPETVVGLKKEQIIETAEKYGLILDVPEGMVIIPSGAFYFGKERVLTKLEKAYFIDRYEVSNAQYLEFLEANKSEDLETLIYFKYSDIVSNDGHTYIKDGKENYPVTGPTFFGAKRYAAWAGKKLPNEMQWEKAANSQTPSPYPWGYEWDSTKCNFKDNGKSDGYIETSPINAFENAKSFYETVNMVGNVWEWIDKGAKNIKLQKGGCYKYDKEFQTNYSTLTAEANRGFPCVGFRCVKEIQ